MIVFHQIIMNDIRTHKFRYRSVSRITGIWHQHAVTRIEKRERNVQNAFFGTDQGQYFVRCKIDMKIAPVPIGKSLTQRRKPVIGLISVCIGLTGAFAQRFNGGFRWWLIGTSYGQVDDIHTLGIHLCHFGQFHGKIVFRYFFYVFRRFYSLRHVHNLCYCSYYILLPDIRPTLSDHQ